MAFVVEQGLGAVPCSQVTCGWAIRCVSGGGWGGGAGEGLGALGGGIIREKGAV